jgi:hypothetical protein
MRIIGCDLHASQQTIAMLDRETGEIVERTLKHEAETCESSTRGSHRVWWSALKPRDQWAGF